MTDRNKHSSRKRNSNTSSNLTDTELTTAYTKLYIDPKIKQLVNLNTKITTNSYSINILNNNKNNKKTPSDVITPIGNGNNYGQSSNSLSSGKINYYHNNNTIFASDCIKHRHQPSIGSETLYYHPTNPGNSGTGNTNNSSNNIANQGHKGHQSYHRTNYQPMVTPNSNIITPNAVYLYQQSITNNVPYYNVNKQTGNNTMATKYTNNELYGMNMNGKVGATILNAPSSQGSYVNLHLNYIQHVQLYNGYLSQSFNPLQSMQQNQQYVNNSHNISGSGVSNNLSTFPQVQLQYLNSLNNQIVWTLNS